jgi:hypothetical protein
MRTDVAILLERLGKREFQYQEFTDRFADVELWPLFETLIRDPRILTAQSAQAAEASVAQHLSASPQQAPAAPAQPAQATTPAEMLAPTDKAPIAATTPADLAALFARYGGAPEDTPSDVHALLQKLAQQLEQGKL